MRDAESLAWSPQYFGGPAGRLFGCYHAAASAAQQGGIVLCYPSGHEYFASYRTMRQLAVKLAQSGVHVLRFDFYGAGDSMGETVDGSPSRWTSDIREAATHLQALQRKPDVSLLGMRLGGTLAAWHLQQSDAVPAGRLILWDPVIDGRAYVSELMALQRQRYGSGENEEICGFPLTTTLRAELERIDLVQIDRITARRVLIVETAAEQERTRAFADRLRRLGADVTHRAFPGTPMWHEPNKTAVPAAIIQAVVSWARDTR